MDFFFSRSGRLVTVSVGLVRTFNRDRDIICLFLGQGGELDTTTLEVEASDLFIEDLGEEVDILLVLALVAVEFELCQGLVGEGEGHDERGVACSEMIGRWVVRVFGGSVEEKVGGMRRGNWMVGKRKFLASQ